MQQMPYWPVEGVESLKDGASVAVESTLTGRVTPSTTTATGAVETQRAPWRSCQGHRDTPL